MSDPKEQTLRDASNPNAVAVDNFTTDEVKRLMADRVDVLVPLVVRNRIGKPMYLYPYQVPLVDGVINRRHPWQLYLWPTGAGKTQALAIGLAILPVLSPGEQMVNISYTQKQSEIIFEETKRISMQSPTLSQWLDRNQAFTGEEINWTNGSSFVCRTANENNKGETLLGLHKTVVTIDESCSISDTIYNEKIGRITAPEGYERLVVEITTSHRRNHVYEASLDPDCKVYRVTWKEAHAAGRFDHMGGIKFIEQRRRRLGPMFKVWYECDFPSVNDDALIDPAWVDQAVHLGRVFGI